jgi:hypothetical protein
MPMFWVRTLLLRRLGPLGLALTAYDLWRRVPRKRRRQIRAAARRHGSRAAASAGALAAGAVVGVRESLSERAARRR